MINKGIFKVCAQACIDSYEGEHGEVKGILTDVKYIDVHHVEGMFGFYKSLPILCFRGSDGAGDWIDNLEAWKDLTPEDWYGQEFHVHHGFLEQYQIIRDKVKKLTRGLDSIIVTGHSLGGALATLAGADLRNSIYSVTVITFGSPRVGGPAFAKFFNKRIDLSYRFVYGNDMVTKVPTLWLGYAHVDKKYQLGKASLKEKLLHPIKYLTGTVSDHRPSNYLKAITDI